MKYQVQENCLTIFLPREVDHHHAEEIRKNADMVIEKNHIKYVIFDFERTEFMDSSGIGAADPACGRGSMGGPHVHADQKNTDVVRRDKNNADL